MEGEERRARVASWLLGEWTNFDDIWHAGAELVSLAGIKYRISKLNMVVVDTLTKITQQTLVSNI